MRKNISAILILLLAALTVLTVPARAEKNPGEPLRVCSSATALLFFMICPKWWPPLPTPTVGRTSWR